MAETERSGFSMRRATYGGLVGVVVGGVAAFMGEPALWWLAVPAGAIIFGIPAAKGDDSSGSSSWSGSSDSSPSDGGGGGGGDGGGGG